MALPSEPDGVPHESATRKGRTLCINQPGLVKQLEMVAHILVAPSRDAWLFRGAFVRMRFDRKQDCAPGPYRAA
jgi:hypothetical protein